MKNVDIQQTDISLSSLVDEVRATGREIVITCDDVAIARLIPCQIASSLKVNYPLRGMPIKIAADFDEPMPEWWEALSE